MNYVYFKLNFYIFLKILFSNKKYFFFLDNKNRSLKKKILINKKNCKFVNFDTAKIFLKNQNIHFYVDKLVINYTKDLLNEFLKHKSIKDINKKTFNNEINIIFSKYIYINLIDAILKIETVNFYIKGKKTFFLNISDFKVKKFIEKKYNIRIFSKLNIINLIFLKNKFIKLIFYIVKPILSNYRSIIEKKSPHILFDTENEINLNTKYRSDFFFLKKNVEKIIISKKFYNSEQKKNGINIISKKKLLFFKQNKIIEQEINQIFKIINSDCKLKSKYEGFINYLGNIQLLMIKFYPIFLYYNIKFFISSNFTSPVSESISLLRQFIKFEAISYQYSYLKKANPVMSTTANHTFIFSNYFKKIFHNSFGKPLQIYSTGYLYGSLIKRYKSYIKYYKKKLNLKKKFVICYFDENCGSNNWCLTSVDDMDRNYDLLANFVLKNSEYCILVKSQFIKNIPSILLNKNENIKEAIKLGRFIEFNHLTSKKIINNKLYANKLDQRNIIMPMMAALLSDITISQKYGATTSLESAIVGKRNVVLNEKKYKTNLDRKFKNIEFSSLEKILNRIQTFRKNKIMNKIDNLGKWENILNQNLKINKNFLFERKINKILNLST